MRIHYHIASASIVFLAMLGFAGAVEYAEYQFVNLGPGSTSFEDMNDVNSDLHTFINDLDTGRSWFSVDGSEKTILIPLVGDYDSSHVKAINQNDQIVGTYFDDDTYTRAQFIWNPPSPGNPSGTITLLTMTRCFGDERAQDLTDDGSMVVGSSYTFLTTGTAWVWDSTEGFRLLPIPEDWQTLLPGAGSSSAYLINEFGAGPHCPEIFGRVRDGVSTMHNVKWIPNKKPTIVSDPVTGAMVGEEYAYDVDATDEDGDALTYGLITCPAGMSIDPSTGMISWIANPAGDHPVEVEVTDVVGGNDTQSFRIGVSASGVQPTVPVLPAVATPAAFALVGLLAWKRRRV